MPCGGGAFQEFFGILAAGKVSYLLHYIPLLLDILDGSELLQKGQNSKLAPFSRWFCVCQHLQGHSWLFHGFSTLFQVSLGFAGGVWGIPEIPGCLVGKRREKLLPEGFGAGKSWIFLGLLPCPGLSRIPPSLIFPPQNFSLISPSWAQSRNSSTSQLIPAPRHRALLGTMSSRAPGTAPEWEGAAPSVAFPQLLLLAAFQVNSGGFGI